MSNRFNPDDFSDLKDYLDAFLAIVAEHDAEEGRRQVLKFFERYRAEIPREASDFLCEFFRTRYGIDLLSDHSIQIDGPGPE